MVSSEDVEFLMQDLTSDKVAVRQKAFAKLDDLLLYPNKLETIRSVLEKGDDPNLTFHKLFNCAHKGVLMHAEKLSITSKIDDEFKIKNYGSVMGNLSKEAASYDYYAVPNNVIVKAVIEVLKNDTYRKYFGTTYFNILGSVIQENKNLASITNKEWKGVLNIMLNFLSSNETKYNFMDMVQCTQRIVDLGCKNSYLSSYLVKSNILTDLPTLLSSRTEAREKLEILIIAYHVCRNIVVDYRFEVCKFTEGITDFLNYAFINKSYERYRLVLIELMDIALIAHTPYLGITERENPVKFEEILQNQYFFDKNKWFYCLRKYEEMICEDLKLITSYYKTKPKPDVHPVTAQFTARLCYYIYWNDEVWRKNKNEDEETASKKIKRSNKLQTILEKINPCSNSLDKFNWKWLTILGEIIHNFPDALQIDDIQNILKILSECQPLIEFDVQIYSFTKCCCVLLLVDDKFKASGNQIVYNHCESLWSKISDEAARVCTSTNKNLVESHIILQLMITNHKYKTKGYIENVVKIFISNSIIKCDTTMNTLIAILTTFNMDSIPMGKELSSKIVDNILEKTTFASLKKVIARYDKPNNQILSHLAVLCCLLKTDVINYVKKFKIKNDTTLGKNSILNDSEYKIQVEELTHLLELKCCNKLLIESKTFLNRSNDIDLNLEENIPKELKCIIDEKIYEQLMTLTEFRLKSINQDSTVIEIKDSIKDILDNTELLMHLASYFLRYEAFNQEKFESSFIIKRIDFNMQESERLYSLLLEKPRAKLDLKDTFDILTVLKSIMKNQYHSAVSRKIRSHNWNSCLKWVNSQINNDFRIFDEDKPYLQYKIGLNQFLKARSDEKVRYLAITTLCEYYNNEGKNETDINNYIEQIRFDIYDNIEIHTVFEILEIFKNQKIPKCIVSWIWDAAIKLICKIFNNHLYIMNCLVEKLSSIMKFSRNIPGMIENVINLFNSFIILFLNEQFNPKLVVKYLQHFKCFHRNYFRLTFDEGPVQKIYKSIYETFLETENLELRMAVIDCLSTIIYNDMASEENTGDNMKVINFCRKKFIKDLSASFVSSLNDNINLSKDEDLNQISKYLQMYTSFYCANFNLRKTLLFDLAKILPQFKELQHKFGSSVMVKILQYLVPLAKNNNITIESVNLFLMNEITINDLLSKWIENSFAINEFPYYIVGYESLEDFVSKDWNLIGAALLKTNISLLQPFLDSIETNEHDLITENIHRCLAFLIPYVSGCNINYSKKAEELKLKIVKIIDPITQNEYLIEYLPRILINLIENVCDIEKFKEICDFNLDLYKCEGSIKNDDFQKCLKYIKDTIGVPENQRLFSYLCIFRSKSVEQLLMLQKKKIQSTELNDRKILHLLHYSIFVEEVLEYMLDENVSQSRSIKDYLTREITSYLSFLTSYENHCGKLREIAANSLLNFFSKIMPKCASYVEKQLNRVIPPLVQVCKQQINDENKILLKSKCFSIVNFLILQQQDMGKDIAKLDMFPSNPEFDELRAKQMNFKYSNGEFTLNEEIEHFLSIKNRKIEGLIELRDHLKAKKHELKFLYEDFKISSENAETSLLHRLLRKLLDYVNASNTDEDRSIEAIKCLGEIGSHDIAAIVFNIDDQSEEITYQSIESIEKLIQFICYKALDRIEVMLLHHNPTILSCANKACYHLLASASSSGYNPSSHLTPFIPNQLSQLKLLYLGPKIDKKLDLLVFLEEHENLPYSNWLKGICDLMFSYAGDKVLVNLIAYQLTFAEHMLPMVFQLILLYDTIETNKDILNALNFFFGQVNTKLNFNEITNEGSIYMNKKAIRQMLKLVEVIRIRCQLNLYSKLTKNLNLNYLHIARAAKYCEAYSSAILYCELFAHRALDVESIEFSRTRKNKTLQDIMFHAYKAIGIKEGAELFISPTTNRSEYLLSNGLYFQSLLECPGDATLEMFTELLNTAKLHNILYNFNNSMMNDKNKYECLWRLSKWDVVVDIDATAKDKKGLVDSESEFEKYHYVALQCLKNDDELGVKNAVLQSRKNIMNLLSHESLECSKTLYKFLEMAQRLSQIEDFAEVRFLRLYESHIGMLEKWKVHDELPFYYEQFERVISQRNSIMSTANIKTGKRTWVPDALQSNLLFTIKHAIIAGYNNDAIKIIAKIKTMENVSLSNKMEALLEEAKLNMTCQKELAKHCLMQVIEERDNQSDYIVKSNAYRLYGEILAENYSSCLIDIEKQYFSTSTNYLEKYANYHNKGHLVANFKETVIEQYSQVLDDEAETDVVLKIRSSAKIFDTIAKYYDREYEDKNKIINSIEFKKKKETYSKNMIRYQHLSVLSRNPASNQDIKKSLVVLKRSTDYDKQEIETAESEKKTAAKNCFYNYVRSTYRNTDENIMNIFRIVSLMLSNYTNINFVKKFVSEKLLLIPSYKFLVALPQLTVRLSDSQDDLLSEQLKKILEKCALDHPQHTLPLILAVVNSYADSEGSLNEPRVLGAKDLWNKLKQHSSLSMIMHQMEKISSGLINLANLNCAKCEIPIQHNVLKLKNLAYVHCPTIDLPIMKNGDYSQSIITVTEWKQKFTNVGGINAPKKIEVLCSDGICRSQLLKGKDDMRQDAIMQQIFGVVNKFLIIDNEMQKKHARIRTYKVVPLSRRSGILEWCTNTIPIGNYLVGERGRGGKIIKAGAHEKYRPNDWIPGKCLLEIANLGHTDNETKLEKFNEICSKIQPVFQHFFYENFKTPGKLFERRYAYTLSVAVSSMIGYILGIGDRHVQNILIDLKTAEIIHIDFGVAFELGKCLPHPELIPFRLTRDIIAPMGVSGVEGIFQKACEKTMSVLRENEKTLMTILEVLLYDPMYSWAVGVENAKRAQLEYDSENENDIDIEDKQEQDSIASRALQRIQAKLQGLVENSFTAYPSIEGQIQYLIQTATNPALLSRLFKGWQAYL